MFPLYNISSLTFLNETILSLLRQVSRNIGVLSVLYIKQQRSKNQHRRQCDQTANKTKEIFFVNFSMNHNLICHIKYIEYNSITDCIDRSMARVLTTHNYTRCFSKLQLVTRALVGERSTGPYLLTTPIISLLSELSPVLPGQYEILKHNHQQI